MLPLELLEQIIVIDSLKSRAVCNLWKDITDDVLIRECETDLNTLLENCRVRVKSSERIVSLRRRLLRYRFQPPFRSPEYKCGACGKPVASISNCECHYVSLKT